MPKRRRLLSVFVRRPVPNWFLQTSCSQFIEEHVRRCVRGAGASFTVRQLYERYAYGLWQLYEPLRAREFCDYLAVARRRGDWQVAPEYANVVPGTKHVLPRTIRCTALFQHNAGEDAEIITFMMFSQEFPDADACGVNRGTAYLSYIDSVKLVQPASIRSTVFQHVVGGYTSWLQRRGFMSMSLWAVPPTSHRQSYIFHCPPPLRPQFETTATSTAMAAESIMSPVPANTRVSGSPRRSPRIGTIGLRRSLPTTTDFQRSVGMHVAMLVVQGAQQKPWVTMLFPCEYIVHLIYQALQLVRAGISRSMCAEADAHLLLE